MKYKEINKAERIANRIGFWLSVTFIMAITVWLSGWFAGQVLGFLVSRNG